MEPKGSLACSQDSAAGPYPEPDESSPYSNTLLNKWPTQVLKHMKRQGLDITDFVVLLRTK